MILVLLFAIFSPVYSHNPNDLSSSPHIDGTQEQHPGSSHLARRVNLIDPFVDYDQSSNNKRKRILPPSDDKSHLTEDVYKAITSGPLPELYGFDADHILLNNGLFPEKISENIRSSKLAAKSSHQSHSFLHPKKQRSLKPKRPRIIAPGNAGQDLGNLYFDYFTRFRAETNYFVVEIGSPSNRARKSQRFSISKYGNLESAEQAARDYQRTSARQLTSGIVAIQDTKYEKKGWGYLVTWHEVRKNGDRILVEKKLPTHAHGSLKSTQISAKILKERLDAVRIE